MSEVQTLSPRSRALLKLADKEAEELGNRYVEPEHLLLASFKAEGIPTTALANVGADYARAREWTQQARMEKRNIVGSALQGASQRTRAALKAAGEQAKTMGHDAIEPEHILLGLLQEANTRETTLRALKVDAEDLRAEVYLALGLPLPVKKSKPISTSAAPPQVEESPLRRFLPPVPTVKEVAHPLEYDLGKDKGIRSLKPVYIFLLLLLLVGFAFGLGRGIGTMTFVGLGILGLVFMAWYFGKRR